MYRQYIAVVMRSYHFFLLIVWGLVCFALHVGCITSVNPKPSTSTYVALTDSVTIGAASVSLNTITIRWSKSSLPTDSFKYYQIDISGKLSDGSPIKSPIRIYSIEDTLSMTFYNLSPNTSYGFGVGTYAVSDTSSTSTIALKAKDETTIKTIAPQLVYKDTANYAFGGDTVINDFSVSPDGTPIFIATNYGIIISNKNFTTTYPLVMRKGIKHITTTLKYVLYSTVDSVFAYDRTNNIISATRLLNVVKIRLSIDAAFIYAVAPDSVTILDMATMGYSGSIPMRNKGLTDIAFDPTNPANLYISSSTGLYKNEPSKSVVTISLLDVEAKNYYTTIANGVFDVNGIYFVRHSKGEDKGTIGFFVYNNSIEYPELNPNGVLLCKYIFLDGNENIFILNNSDVYLYVAGVLYQVPSTVNKVSGVATILYVHDKQYFFVAGGNKISTFRWFLSK